MGPEARIQKSVVDWARKTYAKRLIARKNQAGRMGTNGYPDYEFNCEKRLTFFIEFKAPGEVPTPLQQQRIDELRGLGYPVFVVDSADRGKLIIEEMMLFRRKRR